MAEDTQSTTETPINYEEALSIRRDLIRDTLYNSFGFILTFIYAIISVSLIVYYVGKETYGLYVVCLSIAGWISILDLRIAQAGTREFAIERAKNDKDTMSEILSACLFYNFILFMIVFLVSLFSAEKVAELLKIEGYASKAEAIIGLALVGFPMGKILSCLYGALRGLQRADIVNKISIYSFIPSMVGTWTVLYFGGGVTGLLLFGLASGIIQSIIIFAILSHYGIRIRFFMGIRTIKRIRGLASLGGLILVAELMALILSSDRLIIKLTTGSLTAVALYQFGLSVARQMKEVVFLPLSALLPATAYIWGRNDKELLSRTLSRSTNYSTLFGFSLILFGMVMAEEILIAWLGLDKKSASESALYLRILSIGDIVNIPACAACAIGLAIGMPKIQVKANILASLITILMFATLFRDDARGIALTIMTFFSLAGILYLIMFRMEFSYSISKLLAQDVLPNLFYGILCVIPVAVFKLYVPISVFSRHRFNAILVILVCFTIYLIISLFVTNIRGIIRWRDIFGQRHR